jgi:uncharacterized cupin superfamily protein
MATIAPIGLDVPVSAVDVSDPALYATDSWRPLFTLLMPLRPAACSSQRHWHTRADEMVAGDDETVRRAGDIACIPAGVPNGHHLQNRSCRPCTCLAVGPDPGTVEECHCPDIGLHRGPQGLRRTSEPRR